MNPDHIIRAAADHDAQAIAEVHVRSWQRAYRGLLPDDFLAGLSVARRQAGWARAIGVDDPTLLVGEADGRVAGFVAIGRSRDADARTGDHEIMALYVLPERWSSGLGRGLWLKARDALLARGATRASLWVLAGNERAIRFYRAAGFEPEPGVERTVELGGAPVREVRYVRRLVDAPTSSFSMNARKYNEETMKGLFRKIYPVIAEQAIARTGVRKGLCLDIGGGPGMLGICLAEASDLAVMVVDPLADCIELARENIAERGLDHRVGARQGSAEALPYADETVDLVVSRGSIYFWDDQRQGLREIHRVLRPGGWAYVGGGFGSIELKNEILADMADNEEWNRKREARGRKHPPGHFQSLVEELGLDGAVENGDAGMWIVFRKPEVNA